MLLCILVLDEFYKILQVIQVYIRWVDTKQVMPRLQLVAFDRVFLQPSQALKVMFQIKAEQVQVYDDNAGFTFEKGSKEYGFVLYILHLLICCAAVR